MGRCTSWCQTYSMWKDHLSCKQQRNGTNSRHN